MYSLCLLVRYKERNFYDEIITTGSNFAYKSFNNQRRGISVYYIVIHIQR